MKMRERLTLWFATLLLVSYLLMVGVLHFELVGEYENNMAPETPEKKIVDVLAFYGLPTLIVVLLGGSWIVRRSLRPLESLTASVRRVNADNLSERIPRPGSGDELDQLADAFNEMLARVDTGIASVRDFALHASHELKTPLTILSAETELALADTTYSPAQREHFKSQFEELRRLGVLVDALGVLAKAEAGLASAARERLRFDEMLRAVIEDARYLAAPAHIVIEVARCDPASVKGDPAGLRQLLLNLLDNAIKHNNPGGWVKVDLHTRLDECVLTIENSGDPLPAEILPRVFERFVRASTAGSGYGLGLSIAKTIVEAHRGSIGLAARSGGGAVLIGVLPLSP